jgi:cell wall assembly regulator SMI1
MPDSPDAKARAAQEGSLLESYRRLEEWLEVHRPSAFEDLLPPANETQIAHAEQALGHRFPEELHLFYRAHDGQAGEGPGVFAPFELLDLESALRALRTMSAPRELGLALPIASDGQGRLICVEVAGHAARSVGAVYSFPSDSDPSSALAPDIRTWLDQSLDAEARRRAG